MVASVELENTADRDIASEGLRDRSTMRRTTVQSDEELFAFLDSRFRGNDREGRLA